MYRLRNSAHIIKHSQNTMSNQPATTQSTTMNELVAAQINDVTVPSSATQNLTTSTGSSASTSNSTSNPDDVENVALAVPTEPNAMKAYLGNCTRQVIARYAVQLKQDGRKPKPLSDEQKTKLTLVLRALSNIQALTPALEKSIGLKRALELVMDLPDNALSAKYQFPTPFPEMAKAAYEKFEAENWGNNDEVREDDEEPEDDDDNDTIPGPSSSTTTPGPRRPSSSQNITAVIRRPPPTHPIYGTHGIMHHILVDRSGKMITYKIDDRHQHISAKVFGHNGITVGQWWPLQMCALRDGAHGMRMGGIAGSPTYGAYSIIVSGLYTGMDADYGDRLYYSGSRSHDNTDPAVPVLSAATKALQRSRENGKVVRVLRASAGESTLSPSVGLRYDGLYRVELEETMLNKNGGAYLRFRLRRVGGQPPIDRSRPTVAEKRDYDCVRSYY